MSLLFRSRIGLFLIALLTALSLAAAAPASARSGQAAASAMLTASSEAKKPATPSAPRLRVSGAAEPVRLVSLAVRTEIKSGFAESTLDMEFFNPNRRVLEGELEFPLGPGQEISGLALDIGGELRRGVPVAKARGQEMFDDIARRMVDPALLEATRGNAYKLRVYPLPAGGKRRVVVRVMQPLAAEKGELTYRLPLAFAENIDSVSIEAEIFSPKGEVKAEAGNLGLDLKRRGDVYRGRVERKGVSPEGWLHISLPAPKARAASVTAAGWDDKIYFSAEMRAPLPKMARKLPDLVTILWDASASGLERDLAAEFDLLDKYFKAFGSGRARLIVLREKAEEARVFEIKKGDWQELREAVHSLVYDGATNLGDWAPSPDCREYLLFSDGLSNYGGAGRKLKLGAGQRLFAVNSASAADYGALRGLADGALIDLAHDTPELAEARLLRQGAKISVVNAALAGVGEAALEPGSAYISSADGRDGLIRLAGWVKRGSRLKRIPLQMTLPGGLSSDIALPLPAWDKVTEFTGEDIPLEARLWGRYAIAGLEADYKTNKKAIARLGETLGIVSRETSLIVLETARDYAQYGVTPPPSLKAEVEALRLKGGVLEAEPRLDEARLLSMWQEKVNWWEHGLNSPKSAQATQYRVNSVSGSREVIKIYKGEKISLDFQNRDIHDVIRIIGEVSGKNIVVSDSVAGRVTVKMKDVPWDQALDIILSSRNLGQEESGNVITVYDLPTLNSIRSSREAISRQAAKIHSTKPVPPAAAGQSSPPPAELEVGFLDKAETSRLRAELSAAESGEVRTISAPRVMAADGQKVVLKQGQQIPYKSGSSANTAANVQFRGGRSDQNAAGINTVLGGGVSLPTYYRSNYSRAAETKIAIKPGVSGEPYIARMKEAEDDKLYAVYLDERPAYLHSSAFFFDAADLFFERGMKALGLRVLSNLAEMHLENRQVLRMLAYRLIEAGEMEAALPILEQVRELAPYEPQSLRDLATVKAALGQTQAAVDLLYETARRKWAGRFGDINTIALTEMNALIAASDGKVDTRAIDSRLIKNLTADIRVVLSWDMDNTDINLRVIAPDGEPTAYGPRINRHGGRLSRNVSQGYGPEEFMLKEAAPGLYRVEVEYARNSRQTLEGEVTAEVTIYNKFGTPEQKEERKTLRLKAAGAKASVAEVTVEE